jgi:hypothetical protein
MGAWLHFEHFGKAEGRSWNLAQGSEAAKLNCSKLE